MEKENFSPPANNRCPRIPTHLWFETPKPNHPFYLLNTGVSMSFELLILLKTDLAAISAEQTNTGSYIGVFGQEVHANNDHEPGRNRHFIVVYSGSVFTGCWESCKAWAEEGTAWHSLGPVSVWKLKRVLYGNNAECWGTQRPVKGAVP